MTDVQNIDRALAAAMSDANLNNVIRQYFNNQTITATALPSHPLTGYRPQTVSRGDVEYYVQFLHQKGYLAQFDLPNTVFNFLLPRGTVLTSGDVRKNFAHVSGAEKSDDEKPGERKPIVPENEEDDSKGGLGGYHGSVHIAGQTVYYSADVYSERLADGSANGIPVFAESWKNIVATLYHELQEARTDPDVEDAIRNPSDPNIERKLGWISDAGEEIGDFPLHDNVSLKNIIREVPLTDGSGTVPVQLQYSNAVHGPEGPIATLHPAAQ